MNTDTHEYAVLPRYLTPENMFDGYQYYQTTEHILGIQTTPKSWSGRRQYKYNNPVFKDILTFETNQIYGSILVHANINGKDYYACNGLCDPPRSTGILDIVRRTKAMTGKEYIGQYDMERLMLSELRAEINVTI